MADFDINVILRVRDEGSKVMNGFVSKTKQAARQLGRLPGARGGPGTPGRGRGQKDFFDAANFAGAASGMQQLGGMAQSALGAPISLAMNFEAAANRVNALSGGVFGLGTELDGLKTKARELGKSTEFTATDAMNAFALLTQAGLGYEEQLDAVATVLDFATVGQVDMAKSADLLAGSVGAFGLTADQAERVGDVIARTANSTQANVSEVAASMRKVGPVAKSLGLDIEDVGIAIAALGKGAIRGGEAGTALKSIFASLSALKPRGKEALKALGINPKGIKKALSAGNFAGVLDLLAEGMAKKGITGTKRVAVLEALVGKHHFGKLDQLIQTMEVPEGHLSSWSRLEAAVNNTEITLNKSAGIMRSGTAGAVKTLVSAMEEMGIVVGDELLPVLNPLIQDATQAALAFAAWAKEHPELVRNMGSALMKVVALSAVLTPLLLTMSALKSVTGLFGLFIGSAGTAAGRGAGLFATLATKAGMSAAAIRAVGVASGVLGGIMVGVAAIIAKTRYEVEALRSSTKMLGEKLPETETQIAKTLTDEELMDRERQLRGNYRNALDDYEKDVNNDDFVDSIFGTTADKTHVDTVKAQLDAVEAEKGRRQEVKAGEAVLGLLRSVAMINQAAGVEMKPNERALVRGTGQTDKATEDALTMMENLKLGGELRIVIDSEGKPRVADVESGDLPISVETGMYSEGY